MTALPSIETFAPARLRKADYEVRTVGIDTARALVDVEAGQ